MDNLKKGFNKKIVLVIIALAIIGIIIYLWKNKSIKIPYINSNTNEIEFQNQEHFTALSGLNPLISYDDFGTFNFLLHTDDLPYYDKEFAGIFCGKPDYDSNEEKSTHIRGGIGNNSLSEFINYEGFKVKRNMIPSNYTKNMDLGSLNDSFNKKFLVRKDRPKASYVPPLPQNYFF